MKQVIERKYHLLFGPDLTCLKIVSLKDSKIRNLRTKKYVFIQKKKKTNKNLYVHTSFGGPI